MYTAPHNLYTYDEVMQFVESEDVKFIRLAFCDVRGRQKNVSVMPGELKRAVTYGVSFDASAVPGFADARTRRARVLRRAPPGRDAVRAGLPPASARRGAPGAGTRADGQHRHGI